MPLPPMQRTGSTRTTITVDNALSNGWIVTYQIGGEQYVAVTPGNATRFWMTRMEPARVIIFSIPTPGS